MTQADVIPIPESARVGSRLRIRLQGDQVLEGTVTRVDERTLRVRVPERPGIVVVYRQTAPIEAA